MSVQSAFPGMTAVQKISWMPVPSEMPGMTVPEDEKDASLVSNA
jgi:hypothetical protein